MNRSLQLSTPPDTPPVSGGTVRTPPEAPQALHFEWLMLSQKAVASDRQPRGSQPPAQHDELRSHLPDDEAQAERLSLLSEGEACASEGAWAPDESAEAVPECIEPEGIVGAAVFGTMSHAGMVDLSGAAAAVPGPVPETLHKLCSAVERLLVSAPAGRGAQAWITLSADLLADTKVALERTTSGWTVRVQSLDERLLSDAQTHANALRQRLRRSGVVQVSIVDASVAEEG
jgi:hypothetical protein